MSQIIDSLTRYFRGTPMTDEKRRWVCAQIEGLREANKKLQVQVEMIGVSMACNERHAAEMERILEETK